MRTVNELLRDKGHEIWSIEPESTVFAALALMAEKNVGALVVLSDGQLIGIMSERDYARKVVLKGKASRDTPVREIMTANPVCVMITQTVEECIALMTRKRIRHLPVLDGQRLVGVISIGDVVKEVISEQEFMIEQLEHYITGQR